MWRPTSARKSCRLSAEPTTASRVGLARLDRLLLLGLLALGSRLANLEADRLELARELLDLLVGEIVLERERLELGRLDVAALLALLDERARLFGFQQFVKLILCQAALYVLSVCAATCLL